MLLLRRFIHSESGAVTVYLLIIFFATFLFTGVLIEYSRIMTAERQLQAAVHAGVRSVLSAYDQDLREYGLFGVNLDESDMNDVFNTALQYTLSEGMSDYFALVHTVPAGNGSVTVHGTLADHSWFEHQILEEMKFKAPMELLLGNLSKFEEQLEKGERIADLLEEAADVIESRDKALQNVSREYRKTYNDLKETTYYHEDDSPPRVSSAGINSARRRLDDSQALNTKAEALMDQLYREFPEMQDGDAKVKIYSTNEFAYFHRALDDMLRLIGLVGDETFPGELETHFVQYYGTMSSLGEAEPAGKDDPFNLDDKLKDIPKEEDNPDLYSKLKIYYESYIKQKTSDHSSDSELKETKSALAAARKARGMVSKMREALLGILEDMRDEVYINEYALLHFNCHTDYSGYPEHRSGHVLGKHEVEYIIYGRHAANANFLRACAEIYTIRLAVNFVDGLIKYKGLVYPKAILIAAAKHAVLEASKDLILLRKGDTVDFIPTFLAIPISYKGYLRLFLNMHTSRPNTLARLQALIHLNTDSDLSKRPVHITGEAGASLNLWLLPGITRSLEVTGFLDGKTDGENYLFDRPTGMYY